MNKIVILSKAEFDGLEPPVVYDECDCACPDNGFSFDLAVDKSIGSLRWANLHQGVLPDGNTLFLNPLNDHGVVVL